MIRKWALRSLGLLAAIVIAMLVRMGEVPPASDRRGDSVNDPIEVDESRFSDQLIGRYVKFVAVYQESTLGVGFYTLRDGKPYARCASACLANLEGKPELMVRGRRCTVVGKFKYCQNAVFGDIGPQGPSRDRVGKCSLEIEDGRILE